MPISSRMSSIMGEMEQDYLELFALNLEKLQNLTLVNIVYTLASTNINQSAPNLVKMYVTIRSQMS